MSGPSEEKTEQPTAKKLKDARKKGQIAQGPDFVQACGTVVLTAFAWLYLPKLAANFRDLLILFTEVQPTPLRESLGRLAPVLMWTSLEAVIPAFLLILFATIGASTLINQGFVFSMEPLTPKLDKLDPVKGLKRIFSGKSMANLAKSLVKLVIIGAALGLTVVYTLRLLIQSPACGLACMPSTLSVIAGPTIFVALLILLFSGAVDILIQRFFFLKEMRMTKTEVKRERHESDGNPHIKGAHQRHRREAVLDPRPLGLAKSTVVVHGPDTLVGLRWVRGETAVPLIVCRARSEPSAAAMLTSARLRRIPVHADAVLAKELAALHKPGTHLNEQFFDRFVRVLYSSGAVR